MPTIDDAFDALRGSLLEPFEPGAPGFQVISLFEVMVAVLLERMLGGDHWRSALVGLGEGDLLSPERLAAAEIPEIVDALAEKGISVTSRIGAPLKHLARWYVERVRPGIVLTDRGDTGETPVSTSWLREELSAIKGIGPAAADALVLFALLRPSYPVDRATFRVLVRHGWLDSAATYEEARDLLVERAMARADEQAGQAARALRDLSDGMATVGRRFCRAAAPRCEGCPLEHLLPEGGPRQGDA